MTDSEIFPSSYTTYRKDRNARGGGVFILVHSSLKSVSLNIDGDSCEAVWCRVLLGDGKFLVWPNALRFFDRASVFWTREEASDRRESLPAAPKAIATRASAKVRKAPNEPQPEADVNVPSTSKGSTFTEGARGEPQGMITELLPERRYLGRCQGCQASAPLA
ncbi:hypothetical protein HPB49_008194 [Dermacentor silvarum]|uniref:Uncharacterized protein n=1 Tax=Dermacentor silvarum TaxID=543639 RepID=A0ACB8DXM7_DERSI|nr:hypothetical protein HPB49_008194 [Dermacentor silvarum]